jgi:hypothetical protein
MDADINQRWQTHCSPGMMNWYWGTDSVVGRAPLLEGHCLRQPGLDGIGHASLWYVSWRLIGGHKPIRPAVAQREPRFRNAQAG